MEVKEAIEFLDSVFVNENELKDIEDIISLLKSLEAENKALKILKQAQKDEDKKECIRYQTMYRLKRENKKLKQENKAYKGIVEEIENDFGNGILQNENGFGVKLEHLIEIKKQKYLGGGEWVKERKHKNN